MALPGSTGLWCAPKRIYHASMHPSHRVSGRGQLTAESVVQQSQIAVLEHTHGVPLLGRRVVKTA